MARPKKIAAFPTCRRCGASPLVPHARFCGHCGASLTEAGTNLPEWQRPAPAEYSHVSIPRLALSCPECGEPIRFGFRKVCRQCGAKLVMIPRIMHPNHVRVFVPGPRAAAYGCASLLTHLALLLGILAAFGALVSALK
jgi:ribosomal protein L40E